MGKILGFVRSFIPEILMLLLFGILWSINLDIFDIDPYSELFHIESAKESLASGHFWSPVLSGHDYLVRPPLWTWLVMIFFKLLGVGLTVARIPAVIFSLSGLVLTYILSLHLTQNRVASLFSAIMLGSTWGYFYMGSLSTADILATNLYLIFAWGFLQWHTYASRRNCLALEMDVFSAALGVILGLLLLCKGTPGLLLALFLAISYRLFHHSVKLSGGLNWWLLLGVTLMIPFPWFVGASVKSGNPFFLFDYLINQPISRMLGLNHWQDLRQDMFFYLKRLPLDFMPYLLLFPGMLLDSGFFIGGVRQQNREWFLWLLCWFALGLIFCSVSVFKEPTMMLPFYPPMAILFGDYMSRLMVSQAGDSEFAYQNTLTLYIAGMMLASVVGTVLIFQVVPGDYVQGLWHFPGQAVLSVLKLGDHLIPLPEVFPIWKLWLAPGAFLLLIGGFTLFLLQAERRLALTPIVLITTFMLFLLFLKVVYLPIMDRPLAESFARQINRQVKRGDAIVLASLQPDVKRVLFFLDSKNLRKTYLVRNPGEIMKKYPPDSGTLYGVIGESCFYSEPQDNLRSSLRINRAGWKWNMSRMSEIQKFFVLRSPQFENMKTTMLFFQSLPALPLQENETIVTTGVNALGRKKRSSR